MNIRRIPLAEAVVLLLAWAAIAVAVFAAERSGKWPAVRDAYLAGHPTCEACGVGGPKADLDIHHILPVSLWPEKELDPSNLITLCNQHHCHLMIGHLGDYDAYNPLVREDAAALLAKIKSRPRQREDRGAFLRQFSDRR
jgi:hypothetical protein